MINDIVLELKFSNKHHFILSEDENSTEYILRIKHDDLWIIIPTKSKRDAMDLITKYIRNNNE